MESYYSSDEEIAWGPITLREIKGDLKRPVRIPNRRHTDHTVPYNSLEDYQVESQQCPQTAYDTPPAPSDASNLSQEMINKLNISPTPTEYYTPNESLKTGDNSEFLEKLSKVINEPLEQLSPFSTYASAIDSTKKSLLTNDCFSSVINSEYVNSDDKTRGNAANINDSYINFMRIVPERRTYYDIANFRQTLIASPMSEISNGEMVDRDESVVDQSFEDSLRKNELVSPVINTSIRKENFIVISDDEESHSSEQNNISRSEENNESSELSNSILDDEKDFEYLKPNKSSNEILDKDGSLNDPKRIVNEGDPYCDQQHFEEDQVNEIIEEKGLSTRIVPHILPTIVETRSSTSPISVPEIDLTQFDDSISKSDSLELNDTLDEMNRFLNEGLDYTEFDDELIVDTTPLKSDEKVNTKLTPADIIFGCSSHSHIPVHLPKSKLKTPTAKTQLKTCNSHPAKRQPNTQNVNRTPDNYGNFKIPETPIRSKLTFPTPPKSCPCNLKNVVSPVALYIKNSPSAPLLRKVPQRDISKILTPSKLPSSSGKENFSDFREIVYKPSTKQITSREGNIVLPPSIKRLNVKERRVIKHEGRIGQVPDTKRKMNTLLKTGITDASLDSSMLDSSKDISVLTSKQVFIK